MKSPSVKFLNIPLVNIWECTRLVLVYWSNVKLCILCDVLPAEVELRYCPPDDDVCRYLVGVWKRSLEWREFGPGFQHLRASNSLVVIEESRDAAVEPGTSILDWRFGTDLEDVKLGFSMHFFPSQDETLVEWTYKGRVCRGDYSPASAALSLSFRDDAGLVSNATYRALDANTMMVCLTEVDSTHTPIIQYGHMCRISEDTTNVVQNAGLW